MKEVLMSAIEMTGIPIAEKIYADLKSEIHDLETKGVIPGLGTILVGNDPTCTHYVNKKHETCKELGIAAYNINVSEQSTQKELISAVEEFNSNPLVHSILIQNPVPGKFNFNEAIEAINPEKDADGLHPYNLGKLVL
jgi:methylenetetrahydrofolate dehydrogenase (NADP+)/methenyltetrahydrofolate cyclohydrolase